MAHLTYEERVALEQEKERLRRQREDERRNGAAETRANDSRITGNDDAMHGKAGRKWLGGETGSVSSGDALHGKAGRKRLGGGGSRQGETGGVAFFSTNGKNRISRSGPDGVVRDYDVWGNALSQQRAESDAALYGQMFKDQKATHDEMAQVMEATRRENAKRQLALANDVASAMSFAQGGVIPEPLRNLINRRHGFDGQTTGILPSSGFTSGGSFDLIIGNGVDQNGNVVTSRQSFDPISQYMMMGTNRAAFSDDDRAKMREKLSKQYGFSDKELARIDAGFQQMALASGGGRGNGGSGLEIAKINAEQKEKDRAAKTAKSDREMAFKEKKFEYGVSKDMAKEAKDFFSSLSDEDKEIFAKKYPQMAKSILGLANGSEEPSEEEPTGDDEFVELSPEEYAKLSDEEKKAYKERWMEWKQSQAK